jgi:hypothetical protein
MRFSGSLYPFLSSGGDTIAFLRFLLLVSVLFIRDAFMAQETCIVDVVPLLKLLFIVPSQEGTQDAGE